MPPTAASDSIAALASLMGALQPSPAAADPLAVARGLAEAADLGAWLSNDELAHLLGLARSTVSGWSTGHSPRPDFELERRKVGPSVWWRVTAEAKPKKGKHPHK